MPEQSDHDADTPRAYEVCKPADPAAVAAMPGRRKAPPKPAAKCYAVHVYEAAQRAKSKP
jgi:hypothetical protein